MPSQKILKKIPLVSIVMPVYNCADFLPEALASLYIQTFVDFEVIAINDGSTDESLTILEQFAQIDPRIRIISQKNGGIVKALNRGIKEARGQYIARMDGDDVSFPNRLHEQVRILHSRPDVLLVAGDFEVIDEASRTLYREVVVPDNKFIQRAFYLRNAIAHGSVMFRREIIKSIGTYSNEFGPTEDMELWMRLSRAGKFTATGTCVYRWRVNSNGLTSQNNPESVRQANMHLQRRWQEKEPSYLSRQVLIRHMNSYLIDYGENGIEYKRLFLQDTVQISIKYIKRGDYKKGALQMFAVASTGRQGLGIARRQVTSIIRGRLRR